MRCSSPAFGDHTWRHRLSVGAGPATERKAQRGLDTGVRVAAIGPEYVELAAVLSALRTVVRCREEPSEVWQALLQRMIESSGLPLLAETASAHSQ